MAQENGTDILPRQKLAEEYFGNDASWFEANIPFFECSDAEITRVYYYRWQLYKAHLKDLGQPGYIVTEFLNDVSWAKPYYQSLNDATGFHICEGRWLKDHRYVRDYIDYMFTGGGNDRHFSEAITDAAYQFYLVDADRAYAVKHLDTMEHIFHLWSDHYDFAKELYFIEPLLDATEYSIASIDASGGKDGFRGGQAFRPTINSFMFANAHAISKLAEVAGDKYTARTFAENAAFIKATVEKDLWNEEMQHFIDRYKADNQFVHYWDFIRGRELAGYVPWYFKLPDDDAKYAASWQHLLSPKEFAGTYGLRTVEPSYEYYMRQYRYEPATNPKRPECQWNGAAWPFDTTFVLGAMANLLNDYSQDIIHAGDYVTLLKQYAHQHYSNGKLDLQEDYNPDTGEVIVGLPRSHHYNHSGYADLVISGLCGLRPRADNVLEINPLVTGSSSAQSINYFCLENVIYHGQMLTILYDKDGSHYGKGTGLSIYVEGRQVVVSSTLEKKRIEIPESPFGPMPPHPVDLAVNYLKSGFPMPSASVNNSPDVLYQALDGRVWFYPEIRNYWSNEGSQAPQDWFAIDFGKKTSISAAQLYFYSDDVHFKVPGDCSLEYWAGTDWKAVPNLQKMPAAPIGNGENKFTFPAVETSRLRLVVSNPKAAPFALVEIKVF